MTRVEVTDVPAQRVALIRRTVPLAGLTSFFGEAFGTVAAAVGSSGRSIVGPPFAWYQGIPTETIDVGAGFPVDAALEDPGDVVDVERPGGRVAVALHVGPYDQLATTYEAVETWLAERGLTMQDEMWEEYLTGPEENPDPSTWQTRLICPLRS